MTGTFHNTQTIGEIVAILPEAADIFNRHRIDFCCGGARQLSTAIREQNLNEAEILNELENAFEKSRKTPGSAASFIEMEPDSLVRHILNTHHVYTKRVLPEIEELLIKIMNVHGERHPELFRVQKLFSALKADLEQHLQKEERVLFPMMEAYRNDPAQEVGARIRSAINVMENEHTGAGDILKELREVTEDYQVPEDGCGSYSLAYAKIKELESDLFQHIHLENNILFKKWV